MLAAGMKIRCEQIDCSEIEDQQRELETDYDPERIAIVSKRTFSVDLSILRPVVTKDSGEANVGKSFVLERHQIEVIVDWRTLAIALAQRALRSRALRSQDCSNAVRCKILR